ncbi:MAG: S8 family serine peptidase [Bacteriovoracaceae bacterium]|nr:S8 family serine peptidase [Bacteriovoracaceae bacterium]
MARSQSHISIKNTLRSTLLTLSLLSAPYAFSKDNLKRQSSIPQNLLNKVLKKKYQKPLTTAETDSSDTESAFSLSLLDSQFASWGVEPSNTRSSINLIPAWKTFSKKKEIIVAVIDTGIDPSHPFLKDNIYVPQGTPSSQNYGIDFSKSKISKQQPMDSHGHGTHVSGIIKSVYPGVKILSLKYYNPKASGQDNLNSTIEALRYAVEQNVDIINYSGGGPEPALEELKILKEAERKGILIVAAAGNEESNIDVKSNAYYPASYGLNNIITVTAHDKNLQMLSSSNWGKRSVDISAPGYRIRSALPNSRAGYLTGTSQATAFVSGSAALIMGQYPELRTEEIKEILKQSAKKEITLVSKCSSGGRLDAGKAQVFAAKYLKAKKTRSLANKRQREVATHKTKGKKQGQIFYRRAR